MDLCSDLSWLICYSKSFCVSFFSTLMCHGANSNSENPAVKMLDNCRWWFILLRLTIVKNTFEKPYYPGRMVSIILDPNIVMIKKILLVLWKRYLATQMLNEIEVWHLCYLLQLLPILLTLFVIWNWIITLNPRFTYLTKLH